MKRYIVKTTPKAKSDLLSNVSWWSENHSVKEAETWYARIATAISSLATMPYRCPKVYGNDFDADIRILRFGNGSKPTHRIYFSIEGDNVIVCRVRSMREQRLRRRQDLE